MDRNGHPGQSRQRWPNTPMKRWLERQRIRRGSKQKENQGDVRSGSINKAMYCTLGERSAFAASSDVFDFLARPSHDTNVFRNQIELSARGQLRQIMSFSSIVMVRRRCLYFSDYFVDAHFEST